MIKNYIHILILLVIFSSIVSATKMLPDDYGTSDYSINLISEAENKISIAEEKIEQIEEKGLDTQDSQTVTKVLESSKTALDVAQEKIKNIEENILYKINFSI